MNIQSTYLSVANVLENIFPVILIHVFLLLAWMWVSEKRSNLIWLAEDMLSSATYKRWSKVFDEFSLKSKIPYLLLICLLLYFGLIIVSFGFFINLTRPLSVVWTESDFWLETNDNRVISEIIMVGSYQKDAEHTDVLKIQNFKTIMLEKYKTQYPEQYQTFVKWKLDRAGYAILYYCLSFYTLLVLLIIFYYGAKDKTRSVSMYRYIFLILSAIIYILTSRYQAEQSTEMALLAELSFVRSNIQLDNALDTAGLDNYKQVECAVYAHRIIFEEQEANNGWYSNLWISRWLEPILPRVFSRYSNNPYDFKNACLNMQSIQQRHQSIFVIAAKVPALRELQSAGGKELSALMASILDKAFKGEL